MKALALLLLACLLLTTAPGCRSWFTPSPPKVTHADPDASPTGRDTARGKVGQAATWMGWIAGVLFVLTLAGCIARIALVGLFPIIATVPMNALAATGLASLLCYAAQWFLLVYGAILFEVIAWVTMAVVLVTGAALLLKWGKRLRLYVTGKKQASNGHKAEGIAKLQDATWGVGSARAMKKLEARFGVPS